ncbi:hypothetical protein BaRGS_00037932 [Batillaria attramentaria]|uniref:Uncharacterized protein n=1 Tax=Batillaria attramentaria TaxID=370345 RepID=A0ABD0J7K3_9CAEN
MKLKARKQFVPIKHNQIRLNERLSVFISTIIHLFVPEPLQAKEKLTLMERWNGCRRLKTAFNKAAPSLHYGLDARRLLTERVGFVQGRFFLFAKRVLAGDLSTDVV